MAAHLNYALHNEALAILDGKNDLDLDAARKRIKQAENIVDDVYVDNGGNLKLGE